MACGWFPSNFIYEGPDDAPLVETMLEHGAQIDMRDEAGRTPLRWAIIANHTKTVEVLLRHGANPNSRDEYGQTPFMAACLSAFGSSGADPAVVRLLLSYGADVNAQDYNGDTALGRAVNSDADEIIPQLLAHGANPNLPDKQGLTPIQCAQQHPDLVALLRQAEAQK